MRYYRTIKFLIFFIFCLSQISFADENLLLKTLEGHTEPVLSVSFSPDGKYLASGSTDKTIKLWRVLDGHLIMALEGHTDFVRSVSFSPDGKYLASGSTDKTIKLWRVSDGHLIMALEGHTESVWSVSFSPDGKYLASGSADKTIKLWRVSDGSLIRTLDGHTEPVFSVSFSPDGKYLASGSWDSTIKLWDVSDGHLIMALEGHNSSVGSVSFSPDGKYLASGSWDKTIKLWNVEDGSLIRTLEGHTESVWSVSFSPDGKYLASGSWDKTIKLWNVEDGSLIRTLEGHTESVWSVSFSPDGKYLASGSGDSTIKLWVTPWEIEKRKAIKKYSVIVLGVLILGILIFVLLKKLLLKMLKSEVLKTVSRPEPTAESKSKRAAQTIVSTSEPIRETKLLDEKYELIHEIGRGGMGIVYEAIDKKLDKKVAIKKMREEVKINPRDKERFIKEAKTVAHLHHPYIVDIYQIVEENDEIYLVFEYIDGETIEKLLARKGKFTFMEILDIYHYISEALSYAHKNGVIHRDLKPSNIIVTPEKYVKVMDFGIARQAKDTITRLSGRDTSGTLAYMAPEQELGAWKKESDIFSIGVILYEMLTGELPYNGPNFLAQKERMTYRQATEIVAGLPAGINEVIKKCLDKEAGNRYSSVEDFINELKKIADK